jgi:hypothetical protein
MNRKLISMLFAAALLLGCIAWNDTRREKLVLQDWCRENHLHVRDVHWTWEWSGGRFRRGRRGNIYRFEAVRDGETASHVYWAIITLWRGELSVAVETPAHRFVHVGTGYFPRAPF